MKSPDEWIAIFGRQPLRIIPLTREHMAKIQKDAFRCGYRAKLWDGLKQCLGFKVKREV